MKNLDDLREYLFEALDRLNSSNLKGEELEQEIERCYAMGSVAGQIINATALDIKAKTMGNDKPKMIPNYKNGAIICE